MPSTAHTRSRSSGAKSANLSPPTAIVPATTMSPTRATVTAITLSQTDLDKIEILDRSERRGRLVSSRRDLFEVPRPNLPYQARGNFRVDACSTLRRIRSRAAPISLVVVVIPLSHKLISVCCSISLFSLSCGLCGSFRTQPHTLRALHFIHVDRSHMASQVYNI